MSAPLWQPGTQYLPAAIVTPRSNSVVVTEEPINNSFESGLTGWTVTGEHLSNSSAIAITGISTAEAYDAAQSVTASPHAGDGTGPHATDGKPVGFTVLTNNFEAPVTPGQTINFKCRFWHLFVPDPNATYPWSVGARIAWFDASHAFISYSYATGATSGTVAPPIQVALGAKGMWAFPDTSWVTLNGAAVAPANAAYASAVIVIAVTDYATQADYADFFTWDYTHQGFPPGLVFVATQTGPGTSAAIEPVWPVNSGSTVVDGGVTWTAEFASQVTWTAASILRSGSTQPVWPLTIGGAVLDGTMEWVATDGRVTDPNCPQSKIVAIASAKIYAADDDIIRFSATTNALDWSSSNDAGFIPFGLQTYGNEACSGLGLYRSNLVAFNSLGYQMWQVDPDPANIAILDAEPVGSDFPKSIQPDNNDLVFLNNVGIRNIGTAGASGNLQAGQFGKQVDPIVKALIKQIKASGLEARSVYHPGTGQYFLFFGTTAIVLTINGTSTMSWSRYTFPAVITDFTVMDGVLYMRAGDLVWEFNEDALNDDVQESTAQGGTSTGFQGYMAWNYLDCGTIGIDKQMEGFDLTIGNIDNDGTIIDNDVNCNITFGYNQSNMSQATDPYMITGDTVPGSMVPMPLTAPTIQARLDFGVGQDWGWSLLNMYVRELNNP